MLAPGMRWASFSVKMPLPNTIPSYPRFSYPRGVHHALCPCCAKVPPPPRPSPPRGGGSLGP